MSTYDIVTVGGGVGGSSVAVAMAERGYRVLVVEREQQFKDRVRGEFLFPWGVAEAIELGIYDTLIGAGAHHPKYWSDFAGPDPLPPRDFRTTTPQGLRGLCMYHPHMQEALLQRAESAGAEVRRGARVRSVDGGEVPRVLLEEADGRQVSVSGRLVVAADGRSSRMRKRDGWQKRQDPPGNLFAGVLLERVPVSGESSICMMNPFSCRMVLYFPQSDDTGRAYLASPSEGSTRFHGTSHFQKFLDECTGSGLPSGIFEGARQAGPLATFDGADTWVENPYSNSVALIGDAAATSDPTWGQGLSLTLRDARELRDALLDHEDWDAAGHRYAASHDDYYSKVKTTNSWFSQVFLKPGPEADNLRERVLPLLESDPFFLPDTIVAGPDFAPPTDEHRARIFGLEGDQVAEP